jgi:hypothetical protein
VPIDENRPLELMISSRCRTEVRRDATGTIETLTDLRLRAKHQLEAAFTVAGERLFDVWINEDERKQTADETWYSASEKRARRSDIVVVLFTGDSGSRLAGDMGVCHAELVAAIGDTGTKVRVIDLRPAIVTPGDIDDRFVADVDGRSLVLDEAATGDEAVEKVCGQALAAVRTLAHHGALDVRRRSKSGSEIVWERLAFDQRKLQMEEALDDALRAVVGSPNDVPSPPMRPARAVAGELGGRRVLFVCHGAPAGLSLSISREMVGQPFLRDHVFGDALDTRRKDGIVGPVHVIASFTTSTETQARRLLGFPDATVVKDTWGIWVSDALQRIQLLLIDRCTGASATRARVQQAFSWLRSTGEDVTLADRAVKRAQIVKAMAD